MPAIYTRTGDRGLTGLFGGSRVPKQDIAVEAYGTVDEANSAIGEAKALQRVDGLDAKLHSIQLRLFVVAAELASDEAGRATLGDLVSADDISQLEQLIDDCLAVTGPQRAFVVPGRDAASAALHRARTVVRRAERRVLTLAETREVRPDLVRYLNRLSDALYALARLVEHAHDIAEIEGTVRRAVEAALGQPGAAAIDSFDLSAAQQMAAAVEDEARRMRVPVVFAAVDAGGVPLLLHRMTDSLLGSVDLALGKAYTSAAFRMPTSDLAERAAPGGELYGIQESNNSRVVIFGGGLPVRIADTLVGGIGVSGGTVAEDIHLASHALANISRPAAGTFTAERSTI
ncbi:MAG: cob(I)yrinic acid a,c-diamide adenosyltransferase [Arachnia sp.]